MAQASKKKTETPDERALETARRVIAIEADGLKAMNERLGGNFAEAVELIHSCKGRVVVTGMGKSGQISRKIAATLSSTGTSAVFVHAAEAAHGDLGMFTRGDACLAVSNSGTTEEIVELLPAIKRLGLPLIAVTGGLDSPLATSADVVLDVAVAAEACPLGLAPTASTTATLAMGDALAVAVLERRGFSERDFAVLHPGGALGRALTRVSELMHSGAEAPLVAPELSLKATLEAMSAGGLGVVGVAEGDGRLVGVITDGDIRRAILRSGDLELGAADLMTAAPKTVEAQALAAEALALMEEHSITSLFIVEADSGRPAGIIHLHDLLRAKIA